MEEYDKKKLLNNVLVFKSTYHSAGHTTSVFECRKSYCSSDLLQNRRPKNVGSHALLCLPIKWQ